MLHRRGRPLLLSALVALGSMTSFGLSSCSSDGGDNAAPTTAADTDATQPSGDDTGDAAAGGTPSDASGGGTARITVGEDTWEFEQVVCAFGEEGTGIPGAVFNMAASKDRISLYAADEPDRAYLELTDLDTMDDDDGLSWTTVDDPKFAVDGRKLAGSFDVVHLGVDGSQETQAAQFEAVCP